MQNKFSELWLVGCGCNLCDFRHKLNTICFILQRTKIEAITLVLFSIFCSFGLNWRENRHIFSENASIMFNTTHTLTLNVERQCLASNTHQVKSCYDMNLLTHACNYMELRYSMCCIISQVDVNVSVAYKAFSHF